MNETVRLLGRIDCLVNSAGLTTRGTLLDTSVELFDQHIAINLRAPFFTMQAAVSDMSRRGEPGTIANIISMARLGGQPHLSSCAAAKAGLAGLTRNAAFAHRWDRIRINGVNIGWTQTEGEDDIQRQFHNGPSPRCADPSAPGPTTSNSAPAAPATKQHCASSRTAGSASCTGASKPNRCTTRTPPGATS